MLKFLQAVVVLLQEEIITVEVEEAAAVSVANVVAVSVAKDLHQKEDQQRVSVLTMTAKRKVDLDATEKMIVR